MKFSKSLFVLAFLVTPLFISAQSTNSLTNGLLGHWKFDSIDTTGLTTPDVSSAANIGTIGTSSKLVNGKFGKALRFDMGGSQQFMTVKNNFGAARWTVSAWLNPDLPIPTVAPYSALLTFFSADSAAGAARMLAISKDGVHTYQQKIGDFSFANNPGWHLVTVTYDGTTLSAYVDGTLRGSIPYANILGTSAKRYIGTNASGARGHIFVGAIDEVRLYDRVLSLSEIGAIYTNTTAAPVASTPAVAAPTTAPTVISIAPALPAQPTTKLVSSFTTATDKTIYKIGNTVKATATFTLDPAWITYLKAKGDTKAEVVFEIKDPTGKFLVDITQAFDLVSGPITKSYDWATPATNLALAGTVFSLNVTVRDASRAVKETKALSGLAFEVSPLAVNTTATETEDGVTVIEQNVPSGTSPDIFAGVLASQVLQPNQFTIDFRNTKFLSTTTTSGPFPISLKKQDTESKRAEYRINTVGNLNLSAFNAMDIVAENTADEPVKLTVQVNEYNVFNRGHQGYYILPANSGPRHILVPLSDDITHCNNITGTDDCPMSPRQAITRQLNTNGSPDNSKIGMLRIYIDEMPRDAEFKLFSIKAMSISYAPQYLRNYIDKYGQNNWVDFPEKVTSDAQLRADAAAERTTLAPQPNIWDMYGGDKTATGYGASSKFKTTKVDGKWWLVNPLGNLMYLTAVTQVDYTLTPGYIGDAASAKRGAYVSLDRSGLFSNAFIDNRPCFGKTPLFCGGTTWSAYTANIIRKYSTPTSTFPQIIERWRLNQQNRLREWGFNSITDRFGKNGAGWNTGVRDISFITQFNMKGEPGFQSIIDNRTPDVFDPAFETVVNSVLSTTYNRVYPGTSLRIKDDPYAIGTAPDNEIWWGQGQDANLKNRYNIVLTALGRGNSSPSKVAFTNFLKEKYVNSFDDMKRAWGSAMPTGINSWVEFQANPVVVNGTVTANVQADLSFLLRKFADKYFSLMKTAVRTHGGEGHLFVGARFAGFYRTPKEAIDSCAVYCDIITINYYNYTTDDEKADWDYLLAKDKPVLVTEFYFDSPSRGSAAASRTQTVNDAAQGEAFEDYTRDLLTKPQVIGYTYHDIYDQPLLGSIWSENNLTGFVSETDRIYPELVNAAKRVNFNVYKIRGSRPNTGNPVVNYTLDITKGGLGTVTGAGITCGSDCTETVGAGTSIVLTAAPASGYTFAGWTGACTGTNTACTVLLNANKTVTATFASVEPQTYTLTVTKVGTGTVIGTGISCGTDCTEPVVSGTSVILTATPATGYTFTGWSTCTGVGTCSVPMNAAKTVTATFTRVNTAPSVQPRTLNTTGTPIVFTLTGSDAEGDTLTITTGTPTRGSLVKNLDGGYTYTITPPIPTTAFTDSFNYYASDSRLSGPAARVTINYTPGTYVLTATKTGNGAVTAPQIDCGTDCTGTYNANTVVAVTATPATGNVFSGWSGACTGVGACSVTMNAAKTVTATFNPITYSVNVTKVGSGTVTGNTISCGATCQNVFNYGATVALTATPAAGQTFTGWSGACTGTDACTLTMNGNKNVTATFERTNTAPTTQNLTFTIPSPGTTALITLTGTDPEGDTLTFTPGTPTRGSLVKNPDGKYTYTISAPVPATPFTDTFNYYASDGRLTSTASRVTINYTITPPTMFTLTVAKVGNGTVTAPGIACGGDCQGDFTKDTNAVLTATPATGYTFTGWSTCTGVGTCSVPMNAAKTVTATFTKVNTAPVAAATNATINTSGVAILNLVATDKEGDALTYTVGTPKFGILTQTPDKKYTYTVKLPRPATATVDKFTYTASDGRLSSAPAEISVSIPALPNEPPRVVDTDGDGVIDGNDLCPGTPAVLRSLVNRSGCIRPKVSAFNIKPTFDTDSRNVTNLELGKQNVAKVKYTQPVDIYRNTEQVDLDTNVIISDKRVEIKSNVVPELNKPAIITFYGVTTQNPKILRNGVECKAPQCIVGPNVNGVVEVTVTGF